MSCGRELPEQAIVAQLFKGVGIMLGVIIGLVGVIALGFSLTM